MDAEVNINITISLETAKAQLIEAQRVVDLLSQLRHLNVLIKICSDFKLQIGKGILYTLDVPEEYTPEISGSILSVLKKMYADVEAQIPCK